MRAALPFAEGKKAADSWLAGTLPKDYLWPDAPLDANIAPLIVALNKLPFLYTHSCCGGHKRSRKEVNKLLGIVTRVSPDTLDDGRVNYSGACFSFTIDGSEESKSFVHVLSTLVNHLEYTSIETRSGGLEFAVSLMQQAKPGDFIAPEEADVLALEADARIHMVIGTVKAYL